MYTLYYMMLHNAILNNYYLITSVFMTFSDYFLYLELSRILQIKSC